MTNGTPSHVTIQRHPPERGREALLALACGCSCCCCCCLHSVGGLMGAAAATAMSSTQGDQDGAGKARLGAMLAYWGAFAVLVVGSIVAGFVGGVEVPLIALGLLLPVIQLAAAVFAAPVAIVVGARDQRAALTTLGRIAFLGFGGAVIGTVLMAVIGGIWILVRSV